MKQYDILIVDDERDVAASIRDALAILEIYSPFIASSGTEALEVAAKNHIDAFLVDQIMPVMTGTEFVRKLLTVTPDPLIYIITAEDDGIALAAAEKPAEQGGLPIKRYVQKPWQQSLFTVDLREDLRERDLNRELHRTLKRYSTEQKEIQKRLDNAQIGIAEAEKKDAAMAAAVAVVKAANHEINNINMGFTGCTMRLENFSRGVSDKLQQQEMELLTKLCDSQTRLSVRLKEYAGFVTALFTQTEEKMQPAKLGVIIGGGIDDVAAERDCSAVTIQRNISGEITVPCFAQQLRYALYQILKNAVEAMPGGGQLVINAFEREEKVIVVIADTGKGIPKENLEMIFIPLFTKTKIYGGKGGSIAHRIICENHQGGIEVKSMIEDRLQPESGSKRAHGTTVTLTLPR